MSTPSYVALFALIVMVVLYAIESRWSLAPLGFSVAATIAAGSEFIAGHWPLVAVAVAFALIVSERQRQRRRRNSHQRFSKDWMRRAH